MGIKYSIKLIRNMMHPLDPPKYYPQAQVRESIDIYRIAREIAYATSLTEGDVLNVLQTLITQLRTHLVDGDNVILGEFGSFQYQLRGKGAISLGEFNAATNIKSARIQFRPGNYLKTSMDNLSFDYVVPVKVRQATAKAEKERLRAELGG